MRTREKSKAQLVKEVKALTGQLNLEKLTSTRLLGEKHRLEKDIQDTKDLHADYANCCAERTALETKLKSSDQHVQELKHEISNWKDSYMGMQERMKQMRKNFYQQAALAGELADNAYATVAAVNMESNR